MPMKMKIPPQAKRVFKGVIFDVYQWQQKMYDGSEQTFESLRRPDSVQVIVIQGDHILIANEEQPSLSAALAFLGGRVDEGEEPLKAAQRELLEESGLVSSDWELFKSYEYASKLEFTVYYFMARNCTKVAEPASDPGEKITLKAVTFEEFIDLVVQGKIHGDYLEREVLRMKLDPPKLEAFRLKLFPQQK